MRNLSLAFHKTYYNTLTPHDFSGVEAANQEIFNSRFCHDTDYQAPGKMVTHHFLLTVCYPGLFIGSGNAHDSGTDPMEICTGFYMDYVTGQPCIGASSIKGFLHNHFRDHREAVADLSGLTPSQVRQLESEIFDFQDTFFDAVIYDGHQGLVVGPEYLSPHYAPTESPVPLIMLKLLPEVRLSFRFRLKDSPTMTADDKAELFKKLLTTFSFGAKRSSGFGILREDERNGEIEITSAKCPHCRTLNHRFNLVSKTQNRLWPICFKCKQPLF